MKTSLSLSILAMLGLVQVFVQQLVLVNYGADLGMMYMFFPFLFMFGALLTIADYIDKKERTNTEVST